MFSAVLLCDVDGSPSEGVLQERVQVIVETFGDQRHVSAVNTAHEWGGAGERNGIDVNIFKFDQHPESIKISCTSSKVQGSPANGISLIKFWIEGEDLVNHPLGTHSRYHHQNSDATVHGRIDIESSFDYLDAWIYLAFVERGADDLCRLLFFVTECLHHLDLFSII